jgi:hypothetical protein
MSVKRKVSVSVGTSVEVARTAAVTVTLDGDPAQ